ncbi:MAG: CopD family protein [Deltaproteobacteria bacterium]|nr:CopD family protein [Deltaproteobacteria bacterium]
MSLIMHWLHLVAVVAWIGGLTYILLVVAPVALSIDPATRATIAPRLVRRFLTLVWISVVLLLGTGLYRVFAVQQMWTATAWFSSGYGHILLTKLVLSLLLFGIAGHLTFASYPKLRAHMEEHAMSPAPVACTTCIRMMRKARRMLKLAWVIGLLIILLAARLRGA